MSLSSSLTSPVDREIVVNENGKKRVRCDTIEPNAEPLKGDVAKAAVRAQLDTAAVDEAHRFPMVERRLAYPPYKGQGYATISFLPSRTAAPDKDGVYGMMRVWGTHETIEEAEAHGEMVIAQYDSFHPVHVSKTAYPFFITDERKYAEVTKKIRLDDIAKRMSTESIKAQVKKDKENAMLQKEREALLCKNANGDGGDDEEEEPEDPAEVYAVTLTKMYSQICTILRGERKLRNYKRAFLRASAAKDKFESGKTDQEINELFGKACDLVAKENQSIGVESKTEDFVRSEYRELARASGAVVFAGVAVEDKEEKEGTDLESLSVLLEQCK